MAMGNWRPSFGDLLAIGAVVITGITWLCEPRWAFGLFLSLIIVGLVVAAAIRHDSHPALRIGVSLIVLAIYFVFVGPRLWADYQKHSAPEVAIVPPVVSPSPTVGSSPEEVEAELSIELIIDTIDGQDAGFHVVITNIGNIVAKVTRICYSTSTFLSMELGELSASGPRVISPSAKVSFSGVKPNGMLKDRVLSAIVQYESSANGARKTYTSTFRFSLPDGRLEGARIDPSSLDKSTGSIEAVTGFSAQLSLLKQLSASEGYIVIGIAENNPDGSINVVEIYANGKYLLFDTSNKIAVFSSQYVSGDKNTVVSPIISVTFKTHKAGISWNDARRQVAMAIDGTMAIQK